MGLIGVSAILNGDPSPSAAMVQGETDTCYRMPADQFPLTQEFVAMMLGASRPTVTVVAGTLQKAGLITYHRGHLTIVNREKLESASCECYQTATDLLRNVVRGPRSSKAASK